MNNILRQLQNVSKSLREGNEEDLEHFRRHFKNHPEEADDLYRSVLHLWIDVSAFNGTQNELLRIALKIDCITERCRIACVNLIHTGKISGKSAIFCISEIRFDMLNTLAGFVSSSNHEAKVSNFANHIKDMAVCCLRPFFQDNESSRSTVALELIPVLFNAMDKLKQSNKKFYSKLSAEVFDNIFQSNWDLSAILPLVNMFVDLIPHMRSKQFHFLRKRILEFAPKINSDDIAGIIRVCLRILDINCDQSWVQTVRVLFCCVPSTALQTTETLLEQLFAQYTSLSLFIVDVIEDTVSKPTPIEFITFDLILHIFMQ